MDKISVIGGKKLEGEVVVSRSKNSILPILFSSLLAEGEHVFHHVPFLKDVKTTCLLLEYLGCKIQQDEKTLIIKNQGLKCVEAPYQLVRQMRAGILSLGPLLASQGMARVNLPGGCAIGNRSVDLHLKGLSQMGADIKVEKGLITGKVENRLKGCHILLNSPTVGGTENLMMAGCLAKGHTVIENAACEPEILDLANYLKKMGAKIYGAGTPTIRIEPVETLFPCEYEVIPDRIEAGTLLLAGAITKGSIVVRSCVPDHLSALIVKLKEAGFDIKTYPDAIELQSPSSFSAVDIVTAPYPGFPTDLQAQFVALLTQADEGVGSVTETIFENRFIHVQEMRRLGADIQLDGNTAIVRSKQKLEGAPVMATDLRASACLILTGLVAQGQTTLHRVYHLDRGYENLESKLSQLGASIKRHS